jgi:hypothetical protein
MASSAVDLEDQVKQQDHNERYAHQPHQNAGHDSISVDVNALSGTIGRQFSFPVAQQQVGGNLMARNPAAAVTQVEEVIIGGRSSAAAGRATDWPAIIGGALAAIGVTVILFNAGSGLGLSTAEPWSFANRVPETFAIGAAIWLVVMQWLSSAFGGYLAGRLREKWIGPRPDEVLFRDTAHGLLAWALATVIVAALFALGALGASAAMVADVPAAAQAAPAAAQAAPALTEEAREVAANFSVLTAISLLVGAFIGAVAGGLGGYHRDAP